MAQKSMDVNKRTGPIYWLVRYFFYQNVGAAWVDKPLKFRQESIALLTLLGVGGVAVFTPAFLAFAVVAYLFISGTFATIGYVIVRRDLQKYEATVNNEQNRELMEIHRAQREIKAELVELRRLLEAGIHGRE